MLLFQDPKERKKESRLLLDGIGFNERHHCFIHCISHIFPIPIPPLSTSSLPPCPILPSLHLSHWRDWPPRNPQSPFTLAPRNLLGPLQPDATAAGTLRLFCRALLPLIPQSSAGALSLPFQRYLVCINTNFPKGFQNYVILTERFSRLTHNLCRLQSDWFGGGRRGIQQSQGSLFLFFSCSDPLDSWDLISKGRKPPENRFIANVVGRTGSQVQFKGETKHFKGEQQCFKGQGMSY